MVKFTDIESFRHVVQHVAHYCAYNNLSRPVLNFTGTVKLHGTNGRISRVNQTFVVGGRTRELTIGYDNYGFAMFVHKIPNDKLQEMFDKITTDQTKSVTIFGEWIGKGIQSKVAVSELDKMFVVFAVMVDGEYVVNNVDFSIPEHRVFNILEVPTYHVTVDFNQSEAVVEQLASLTEAVEQKCPWGSKFGVDGIGEGIVWTCDQRPTDAGLFFKTKGERHAGGKVKKLVVHASPEKVDTIQRVVELVLPIWRLEQGITHLKENNLPVDMKSTGEYLKWISQDVIKEEIDVLVANNVDWKEIAPYINTAARTYFKNKVETTF
jgi:hypothetical protein